MLQIFRWASAALRQRDCHHFLGFLVCIWRADRGLHPAPPIGWWWQVGGAKGSDKEGLEEDKRGGAKACELMTSHTGKAYLGLCC